MQTRRKQQPRINRSRTEKGKGLYKTLVVVAGLVLSLVGAYSRADAQQWPPPPTGPRDAVFPYIGGAQIVGITFGPDNPYGYRLPWTRITKMDVVQRALLSSSPPQS